MSKNKRIEDHVSVRFVPEDWTGVENPYAEITLKRGKYDESDVIIMKSCIGEALLRFAALTQKPLKAEIKP